MGCASSTKITGDGTKSSTNEANVGGPPEERHGQPFTKATSAVGQDETDAEPAKQNSIVSSKPEDNSDKQNAGVSSENKVEDAPSELADSSYLQLMEIAAAKAKRIEGLSGEVKGQLKIVKCQINHVQSCQEFPCSTCFEIIKAIRDLFHYEIIDREAMSEGLALDSEFCQMFAYTWRKRDLLQMIDEADPRAGDLFTFYIQLLGSAWVSTDKSDDFCVQMDQDECVSLIVDWLLVHHESQKAMNDWVDEMSFVVMNIVNNVCRRVPSLSPKHHRVVPVIQKFGESDETLTQTIAFITLAKLVRKEEADKLSTNYTCIVSLLYLMKQCLSESDHAIIAKRKETLLSFPAVELVEAVEQLAINDNNKRLIVEKGGILILGKFLKSDCSDEEKTYAANAIWRLAFLKENMAQLRKDQDIIYNLTINSKSGNEKLRNACLGALFEIYESRLPEALTDKKADNGSTKKAPSDNAAKSSGHIMLSYKWEHPSKPVMREFKKQLQNRGFKVWMDEDHMMGDKIAAMTDAVENADMILACITRGYQDSQDCRTEATYAYECKKKIIPVKVDEFKPTGWLGGITAGKIYYMVKEAHLVSNVLPSIIEKEFAAQSDKAVDIKAASGLPPPKPESKPSAAESNVSGWDCKKVKNWLAANNVSTRHEALKNVNGGQLLQLKKQLTASPQAFYSSMTDNLKIPYLEVMSFAAALEKLN